MTDPILAGSKGGGAKPPRPSVEAPDSLHSTAYARILDLVSEGEIVGLKNGKRSVFLNETPLANADGSLNFSGVSLETRNGSQDQTYIPGFPAVENESQVAVELRSDQPWTRAITNLQLSAVRIRLAVSRLAQTNTSNGDTNGYTVRYAIELSTDGGAFVEVLQSAFSGKSSSKYERSHRVDLPAAKAGWTVRVRRLTANSSSGAIADTTSVESITDVIDAKLRYPGSAIIGLQFDASQFQSIPNRSFELQGRIIRVPSNYDPASRAYSGVWDGTFKSAWTDNPAWIYYDLLLHQRYGLGHLLNAAQVDKWELYRIGQYCDQPVSDGKGGTEPRFTCNLYLSVRADALKVLQDLATTFRGMAYWGAGSVMAVADMPEDPVYTYSNANVIDGKFVYGGSAKKTRYSVALVSWNDPADFYRQKVQYVDDPEGIARYGVQQTEITATGCTSQAQAQRIGKWALLTNRLETESVSFSVGLDGTLVRPGQVIRVADNDRAGRRIGGRLRSATLDALVLDADVKAFPGDTLTLIMPTGKAISRVIKSVGYPLTWDSTGITWDSGATTLDTTGFPAEVQRVVLEKKLEQLPPVHSMWAIDSPTLAVQQFRVLSVAEDFSDSAIKYSISAVKHVGAKFAAIDNGARIDQPPVTVIPPSVQNPPKNVRVRNEHFVDQGSAVGVMTIDWERPDNAIAYEVHWRKNDGDWVFAGRTGGNAFEVSGIYAGRYVAKVRAINALDIGSVFATSAETVLSGKTTPPPMVASFNAESIVFGIKLKWSIPAGLSTADLQRTEIWYSQGSDVATATKFGDYAYPQTDLTIMGLAAGVRFFFWARLVDKIGNLGAFHGPVTGQSSSDAGPILEYLSDKISETQLSQHLLQKIESGGGAQVEVETVKRELAAMYSIKTQLTVDNKPYLAGIGVGVENDKGVITSQVLVAANRFAVVDPNTAKAVSPFVIENGATYINSAFIQNGSINMLKIGDNLQSDNYVSQTTGWKLGKDGSFEINGIVPGQGRMTINNRAIKIIDSLGVVRVQMGDLTA
ncbi:host specificity protein J [Pseudomonas sp. MPFS]|uniref:host specificity protein J n=1 Tax=Pseudomonas sp. MPFS TaxID=2795724 RepID=UPI001F12B0B6|nr:host specificity protein J [Pseudomonas sp. MPFS]UMZ13305.1 host specificity protein J [Pseudomonas sp. MPFS]